MHTCTHTLLLLPRAAVSEAERRAQELEVAAQEAAQALVATEEKVAQERAAERTLTKLGEWVDIWNEGISHNISGCYCWSQT
jgi:hypothetical protein